MKAIIYFSFAFLFVVTAAQASSLKVTFTPLDSDAGHVLWSVFNTEASFPDHPQWDGKVTAEEAQEKGLIVEALPAGTYAFTAFHDANDNGKLDKDIFGRPTEMFGISNITKPLWSQPTWDQVKFEIEADKEKAISLVMKYQ